MVILGSGNWGTTAALLVANNLKRGGGCDAFSPIVKMWVFEELYEGKKLSAIINDTHENPKYLPGVELPDTVVAVADPIEATRDATHLVFVLPHQFLERLCRTLKQSGVVRADAVSISLIKGITFSITGPILVSDSIRTSLGTQCGVLMGANVADEVAHGLFSEATIGVDQGDGKDWLDLFHDHTAFRCVVRAGVAAIEVMGALKNVVALAAGIAQGLKFGNNCKAALMRIGFAEMRTFIEEFFEVRGAWFSFSLFYQHRVFSPQLHLRNQIHEFTGKVVELLIWLQPVTVVETSSALPSLPRRLGNPFARLKKRFSMDKCCRAP